MNTMDTICVFDSDGNPIDGTFNSVDEALRAAFSIVCHTWPDYEIATVSAVPPSHWPDAEPVPLATVARAGARGTRRVRIALAGCGWVAMEIEVPGTLPAVAGSAR